MKKYFRLVGYLEAISCLALFGMAMPLKYFLGLTYATKVPGLIHGILFLIYISLANKISQEEGWKRKKLWTAYAASVLPLGTFFFDQKFLRQQQVGE